MIIKSYVNNIEYDYDIFLRTIKESYPTPNYLSISLICQLILMIIPKVDKLYFSRPQRIKSSSRASYRSELFDEKIP